jgi:hypothetical protein
METHDVKVMADGAAFTIGLSNIMQWLPPIVTFISSIVVLLYMLVRLWETETVRSIFKGKQNG